MITAQPNARMEVTGLRLMFATASNTRGALDFLE